MLQHGEPESLAFADALKTHRVCGHRIAWRMRCGRYISSFLTLDPRATAAGGLCVAGGLWSFTFAAPDLEAVWAYLLNQEEHQRVKTFQEECLAMLKRGMVAHAERFL